MTYSQRFKLLLACLILFLPSALLGQYFTYHSFSFGRPHAGGDLALRFMMIEDSTIQMIRTYAPHEIADFDPLLSPNKINFNLGYLIYGKDTANVWSYYLLHRGNGHIMHRWTLQTVVPRVVALDGADTLYIIGPPPGGGNERLVKLAINTGTETLVGTFLPGQLATTGPSYLRTDDFYGPVFLSTINAANVSRILSIDRFTAQVDTIWTTPTYPILAMDAEGGGWLTYLYVLTQPYGQSSHVLWRIHVGSGTGQVMNTIPQSEFYDFHPNTFFIGRMDFVVTALDSSGHEQVKAFYQDGGYGSAAISKLDPGAYDAKVLAPNEIILVAANDPTFPAVTAYPNPSSEDVRIQGAELGSSFTLMNNSGQTIRRGVIDGKVISLAGLPAGIYLVQVGDGTARQVVRIAKQ